MTRETSKTLNVEKEDDVHPLNGTLNCFKDNTPVDVLTRQYRVADFVITPGWNYATRVELDFPQALFDSSVLLQDYIRPFKWLHSGIEISVQVNATVFHQGMMVSCFIYDATTNAANLNNLEMSVTQANYYNYSTSDTAVLRYGWRPAVTGLDLGDVGAGAAIGKFILAPQIALANSGGGDESITVSVLARFIRPKVFGYKTVSNARGRVTKQSATSEEKVKTENHSLFGPVGTLAKGFIGTVSGAIGDIEDLGDLITGGLLDKPTALDYPTKVYQDLGSEFVTGKGTSIATKLQMYPEFKLGQDLNFEGSDFTSNKTFRQLAMVPALHHVADISPPAYTYQLGVTPAFVGNQNTYVEAGVTIYQPDYLQAVAALHTYWRGSIKYHIKFVTSSMTTGRMRISYMTEDIPNPTGGDNPNVIVDIKGTTTFNLTVPFLHDQVMRNTGDVAVTIPAIYFSWLVPPITSGVSEPNISMMIFRSGGPDMIFALPILQNTGVEKQSNLVDEFHGKFPSFALGDKFSKYKGVTVTEQSGYICDLLKRYHAYVKDPTDPNLLISNEFLMTMPYTYAVPGVFHPFVYFCSLFKYVRGGARFGYQAAAGTTAVNYVTPSANAVEFNEGSGFYIQNPVSNRFCFVELPYMSTSPYICKTLNPNYASYYALDHTTIAGPSNSEKYFLSFADDRIMFHLLPPPRTIITPATKKPGMVSNKTKQ